MALYASSPNSVRLYLLLTFLTNLPTVSLDILKLNCLLVRFNSSIISLEVKLFSVQVESFAMTLTRSKYRSCEKTFKIQIRAAELDFLIPVTDCLIIVHVPLTL